MEPKKLHLSNDHRWVSGVIGGIAEYYSIDPLVPRLLFIIFLLITGVFPGIFIYLIALILMPKKPLFTPSKPVTDDPAVDADTTV